MKKNFSTFFHWFAWSISLLASSFFVIFLIGKGIPNIIAGKDKEFLIFLPFLLLAITVCALSFFKKKPGAIMMIAGGIAMVVAIYFQDGIAGFGIMMIYGITYIMPGGLLLIDDKSVN